MKYWLAGLLFLVGILGVTQFTLRSQNSATVVAAPETVSFRLAFGVEDKATAKWDGAMQIPGGRIASVEGWRFAPADRIEDHAWKLATEETRRGAETVLGISDKFQAAPEHRGIYRPVTAAASAQPRKVAV